MSYKVINDFLEKFHDNHLYKNGDKYPKKGYKADPERVAFLQTDQNKYHIPFLGDQIKRGNNKSNRTGEK